MWTEITRSDYERRGGRYASDITDHEWALLVPFMPARKKNCRPRTTAMRDVMDAILYMASTGCQWAMLPNDFPPAFDGATLFLRLEGQRFAAHDEPSPCHGSP